MEELEREEYLQIDLREFEREKRHKPKEEVLKQLKYIKKRRLENKKEFFNYSTIEQEIGFLLSQDARGKNKAELIKLIIFKLQELQIQKKFLDFSREFLRNLFKEYSNINDRKIRRRMEEILMYAKAKERVKTNYYFVNKGVDRIKEPRNKVYIAYTFI